MTASDDHNVPASAEERIEEFAEFLDQLDDAEDHKDETGDQPGEDEPTRADEPGDPAIVPPVSWDADAKDLFKQLPPELQTKISEREAQRERAVQTATTSAAEAKRNALVEASASFAEQQRHYAAHLQQIASQIAVQRPDPALLAQDPQAFYEAQAQYEAQAAHQAALTRQAAQVQGEAQQREAIARQYELAQDHAQLGAVLGDDWTDSNRRHALLTDLEQVGAELGYSRELMAQASAIDIVALKAAAEWKAKAARYDALQASKPDAVRAAGNAPRVAKPGVAPSRTEQAARSRDTAWARAKSERSGDAYAAMLDSMGIKL